MLDSTGTSFAIVSSTCTAFLCGRVAISLPSTVAYNDWCQIASRQQSTGVACKEMMMGEALLPVGTSYAEVYTRFRWQLPTTFNIGVDVCDRHADDPSRLAMIYEDDTGQVSTHTFAELRAG